MEPTAKSRGREKEGRMAGRTESGEGRMHSRNASVCATL